MNRTIFILLPSPHPAGPIKGAIALANSLAPQHRIVITYLKHGPGVDSVLDVRVEVIYLAKTSGGWRDRLLEYRALLRAAGGRTRVVSLSMCFSADMLNQFCSQDALICSSVRGNLPKNYRLDYGIIAVPAAIFHLYILRSFDCVFAMTASMAKQIRNISGIEAKIIANFVDEQALEPFRCAPRPSTDPIQFVFVGSLSRRKQPNLVVIAIENLIKQGYDVRLDLIGDGPMREKIQRLVVQRQLAQFIRIHYQVSNPFQFIATADAFVLPSYSEGISRSSLESLYLGVPCVLRNVDGNSELLAARGSGELFSQDRDLARAMILAGINGRRRKFKSSLLPPHFRQPRASTQYRRVFEALE
jgi:glycosyltransferase involved in cell wall biosynthesis